MRKIIKILLLMMASMPLRAQETMTLHDCMEYAVKHSTKMAAEAADRSDERIAHRDAILGMFTPYVGSDISAYSSFGRAIDPETNTYINTVSFNNGYSLGASIMLFDGFKAVNNLKISATAERLGVARSRQAEDILCLAVMEAYCNAVYFSSLYEAVYEQVKSAESALMLAARQEELGLKSHADVVQVEADLADRQLTLVNTSNLREDALLTLKDLLFWPADKALVIDCSMAQGWKSESHEDAATVLESALQHHPRILIAKGNAERARYELSTARWGLAPSLSLSGGISTTYYTYPGSGAKQTPFSAQLSDHMGEYLNLSLNIPIFDRLAIHSEIGRKRNALKRADAEFEQSRRDVQNEVIRALNDCEGAQAAFFQANRLENAQKEAWSLNLRRFEQGLISSIEFQTASGKYLQAKASKLDALLKLYIKSAVVRYYNGESYLNQ